MPVLRSGKINCFSCGKASIPGPSASRHPNGRVSYFVCPFCEADNYRDELGDIVDYVPATPKRTTPAFAHRVQPGPALPDSPAFCRTCQHNQHVVTALLNQFEIPPEDDPKYKQKVEVELPAYKKMLEARHPQVCENCRPKVSQKIKKSNYAAKAATLAAMRERTDASHKKKPPTYEARWLTVVWYVRGGMWIASHALFLAWHLSAAIHPNGSEGYFRDNTPRFYYCLKRSILETKLDSSCYDTTASLVQNYGLFSLLGFFWVYRQRQVERNPSKKLGGVSKFLKLEIAMSILRLTSWKLLTPGAVLWTGIAFQQAHIIMGIIYLIFLFFSVTSLRLESPPPFSLREATFSEPPSTSSATFEDPLSSLQLTDTPRPITETISHLSKTIQPTLQPTSARQLPYTASPSMSYRDRIPTASPEPTPYRQTYTDPDAMDWTPISSPTKPRLPTTLQQPPPALHPTTTNTNTFGPSPFAYAPTLHAARHPTLNLFSQPPKPPTPPPAPHPFLLPQKPHSTLPSLAPARFHPPARRDAVEDGITSLLSGRLTLDDASTNYDSDASTTVLDPPPPSSSPNLFNRPEEHISTILLRVTILCMVCYILQNPSYWTFPALLALVWRGTVEYPDLGVMTVAAAAVVAVGGAVVGMMKDVKGGEVVGEMLGKGVAGIVLAGDVVDVLGRGVRVLLGAAGGSSLSDGEGDFDGDGDDHGVLIKQEPLDPEPSHTMPTATTTQSRNRRSQNTNLSQSAFGAYSTRSPQKSTFGTPPSTPSLSEAGAGRGVVATTTTTGTTSLSKREGNTSGMYVERGRERVAPREARKRGKRGKSVGGMMSGLTL